MWVTFPCIHSPYSSVSSQWAYMTEEQLLHKTEMEEKHSLVETSFTLHQMLHKTVKNIIHNADTVLNEHLYDI